MVPVMFFPNSVKFSSRTLLSLYQPLKCKWETAHRMVRNQQIQWKILLLHPWTCDWWELNFAQPMGFHMNRDKVGCSSTLWPEFGRLTVLTLKIMHTVTMFKISYRLNKVYSLSWVGWLFLRDTCHIFIWWLNLFINSYLHMYHF